MRAERLRLLAWSLLCAAVLLALAGVALGLQVPPSEGGTPLTVVILGAGSVTYPIVGAFIAARQPRNAVAWIIIAAGVAMALVSATAGYARFSLSVSRATLPGTEIAAWVASWVFVPALGLAAAILLLLFPTGRPPNHRWRPVVWITVIATGATAIGYALRPGPLALAVSLDNPFGLEIFGIAGVLADAGDVVFPAVVAIGAASMLVRYRAASAEERRQIAWFAYAACVAAAGLLVARLPAGVLVVIGWIVAGIGLVALPVAIGIAVTKHRLYDIDLILSRTLVYVGLIGILGGVYAASIALFQRLFAGVTGDRSDAAVVLTTLILAGLFTPARKALEGIVDRRFKPPPGGEPPGPEGASGALTRQDLERAMEPVLQRLAALERRHRR